MYKVQIKDRTKEKNLATYYLEDVTRLLNHWEENGEKVMPMVSEVELKVGAKQDFTLNKSVITLHNTTGNEGRYYVESLLVKLRWAVLDGRYVKLGAFEVTGIAKENTYGDGGFEQVTCCGNPVLAYYGSPVTPIVSEFEDDFVNEKITMLAYKVLNVFENVEEVNADIAKKVITDAEVESLLHDIPGEIG